MNKLILVLALLLPTLVKSQDEHFSYKNALKISPVEMGKAEFQLAYERYFGDRTSSVLLVPSFILKDEGLESQSGWQAMVQYRFYLTHVRKDEKKVPFGMHNLGFYAGAYGLFLDYKKDYYGGYYDPITNQYYNDIFHKEVTAYEGGAILGLQIDITPRILLDFFVGGGIRFSEVDDNYIATEESPNFNYYGVFDPEYKGVKPRLGLQVGISF